MSALTNAGPLGRKGRRLIPAASPSPVADPVPAPKRSPWIPANVRLFLALAVLLMALFSAMRLGLILSVRSAGDATWGELSRAFLVGLRFDFTATCYVLGPVMLMAYVPWTCPWRGPKTRRLFLWVVTAIVSIIALTLFAEFNFFKEFQTRFNQLAVRYLKPEQITTVVGMVWYDYPVVRYLLGWLAGTAILYLALRTAFRWAGKVAVAGRPRWTTELAGILVIVATVVIGARGGVQMEPIRWGDAFGGDNEFVSQMTLNGVICLGQAVVETFGRGERSGGWAGHMTDNEARLVARKMIVAPTETLLSPDNRAILRKGDGGSSLQLKGEAGRPPNVVVVMMESFSARYSGATGAPRSFTPSFDAVAKDGILFDRCFSAGSHTHQGIFATQLGFPNLPGYETLMESGAGNQEFLSLPAVFQGRGYKTFFLYNGNFSWDNMRGFFRKQGVDTFVGGDDMKADAKFLDAVWGVSDGDLFDRCNREFEAASQKGPFFAAVMTLSNHVPFQVPPVPGEEPITDMGGYNARLTAMRYADYAVGKFVDDAKKLSYFKNTLFVFVGDHGFAVRPVLTEVNLLFHHVPLLFYAPGLTDRKGVDHRVASHMNVVPSVMALVGAADSPQAGWARSLFNDKFADENFAVFKMSGGGKAVALARGDDLLVMSDAKAEPKLLKYTLWPPGTTPAADPGAEERRKAMTKELKGYVQAALADLTEHEAGPVGK